jgi:beta-lactamase regulating signal transducer with metallopeptidase domain
VTLLVAWLWQGVALACIAELALCIVPRHAAMRRHRVWWCALAAVLLVPVAHADFWLAGSPAAAAALGEAATAAGVGPASSAALLLLSAPPAWALWVAALAWAACAGAGATRAVHGWVAIQRVVAGARPLGPREEGLSTWSQLRTTGRRPVLRVSRDVRGACAVGLRRPSVLVSEALAESLDDERLEHVVLHELAHLERYDDWWTLVRRAVLVVVGFHPAVRWICRRIELEMEAACDARVVSRTGDPVAYARSLLDVAALTAASSRLRAAIAPGASGDMPVLRTRVERLAAHASPRTAVAAAASTGCMVILACAAVGAGALPPLLAFENALELTDPAVASPRQVRAPVSERTGVDRRRDDALPTSGALPRAGSRASSAASVPALRAVATGRVGATRAGELVVISQEEPDESRDRADSSAPVPPPSHEDLPPARALAVTWHLPDDASTIAHAGRRLAIVDAAQRSAAGMTRAAQSTAGAFTRVGQAAASAF